MKTFTNVQEWLKSKPSEEEISKVLKVINQGAKRELKRELWLKQKEMIKIMKFEKSMNELGYKIPPEMIEKLKELESETKAIKSEIGEPVKRVKKAPLPEINPEELNK